MGNGIEAIDVYFCSAQLADTDSLPELETANESVTDSHIHYLRESVCSSAGSGTYFFLIKLNRKKKKE